MLVTVVAVRDFYLGDYHVHQGEGIEVTPIEAAIQARLHNVTLDRAARPTYHTRDMVAAPVAVVPVVVPVEVSPAPLAKRRGRPRKVKA